MEMAWKAKGMEKKVARRRRLWTRLLPARNGLHWLGEKN